MSEIALQIQQSKELDWILQVAIDHARELLNTDRVIVYRFLDNQDAVVAFESIGTEWTPILGQLIYDPCMGASWIDRYQRGQLATITDIHNGTIAPCYRELLERLEVQANLVVPVLQQDNLWGLLIAHHCRSPREWQPLEIQLLQHIALQMGIAIQQAALRFQPGLAQSLTPQTEYPGKAAIALQQTHLYQQLQASEQQYQNLVENSPDIIERFDLQLRHLYVSPALTKITGIPSEMFLGKSCRELSMDPTMVNAWEAAATALLTTGQKQIIEFEIPTLEGVRSFEMVIAPEFSEHQTIESILCISRDTTDRKAIAAALREQQRFTEQIAESTLAILYVYDLSQQRNIYVNPQIEMVLGYSPEEIQTMGDALFPMLIHPDDLPRIITNQQHLLQIQDGEFVETEYRMQHKSGGYCWLLSRDRVFSRAADGTPTQILGVATDITQQKETQAVLHQQAEQQRLLSEVAQHIRQTLDLDQILQTTVTEVRKFLNTDRVIIYQFHPDWSGTIIAESVAQGWKSILGMQITDTYFVENRGQNYSQGHVKATSNIYTANLDLCHLALLEQMQVQAKLVVPILQDDRLWGLLVAQHCQSCRQWETLEIELQQQLATQIVIAIQQSVLYRQVQTLNTNLELQVQERTAQLQQVLDFEALLKRITDQVRDSLDEAQILQKVVQELAIALGAECCDTGSYNCDRTTVTIQYEYTNDESTAEHSVFAIANSSDPNIYVPLLQGQSVQFCLIGQNVIRPDQSPQSILACPIANEQGVFGDLWLFKSAYETWNDLEVRLVQQVVNQCAIALRQSRLYQESQTQVQELERLNQLKDDFLSTVSHELRSPMSSIKMATQLLEISLTPLGLLEDPDAPINRYFKILQEEGQREINLINDLLDLARLDAGTEPLNFTPIMLQFHIPYLAETFVERARQQQQQLVTQIPEHLPPLVTDLPFLERILTELLHNACKYTPAGGTITVSAQSTLEALEIRVSNSGVEISPIECDRIFDKFYRIPNNDPWKHGGTGLGLALVKKLTERIGGHIRVESRDGKTVFTLKFSSCNPSAAPEGCASRLTSR